MRTVIVRLFTSTDTHAAAQLHGMLEIPGGTSVPFAGGDELVAALVRLARDGQLAIAEGDGPGATLIPPEVTSGG